MKLLQQKRGNNAPLGIKQISVPDVQIAFANAVRLWSDARGKMHFEYLAIQPRCAPNTCSHAGQTQVHGPRGRAVTVRYTWARSSAFHLRCGDCGAELR